MLPAWIIDFFQPQGVKCLRCGMAYFDELNAGLCPMCALHVSRMEPGDLRHELEHGRGELDWAAAAFRYGDGVRQRVLALKFSGARRLGEDMGRDMLEAFNALPVSPDALVPVPLHWRRKISRGYNQAEVLSCALGEAGGAAVDTSALVRRRYTRRNARLGHDARLSNVAGAFAAAGDVRGKRLLLIDDVLTTGATASQCAHALKAGGAAWVGMLTYARAGGRGEDRETAGQADFEV